MFTDNVSFVAEMAGREGTIPGSIRIVALPVPLVGCSVVRVVVRIGAYAHSMTGTAHSMGEIDMLAREAVACMVSRVVGPMSVGIGCMSYC